MSNEVNLVGKDELDSPIGGDDFTSGKDRLTSKLKSFGEQQGEYDRVSKDPTSNMSAQS